MRTIVALAILAAVASAATLTSCTRNGVQFRNGLKFPFSLENTTHHFADPNVCNTIERPYCILMNQHATAYDSADRETHEYGCAECRSDCDCPLGKYCQGRFSEADDFGTCVSYKEKLDKPCNPYLKDNTFQEPNTVWSKDNTFQEPNPVWSKDLIYGDQMFCGIVRTLDMGLEYVHMKGTYNRSYTVSVWKGSCVQGYCKECNSWMLPNPSHTENDIWYTGSMQDVNAARTLRCFSSGDIRSNSDSSGDIRSNSDHKYKPKVCDNFHWSYTNGISVAAPAAAILAVAALLAF